MSGARRVLVVEDDESIREAIEMALTGEGYEVRLADDGSAALALLERWQPGVILLDMKMPGVDGWAFATAYRQRPAPRPPVVVVTAAGDAASWAAEIAADDVLAKPFDLDRLLELVDRYTAPA